MKKTKAQQAAELGITRVALRNREKVRTLELFDKDGQAYMVNPKQVTKKLKVENDE